jgi:hypothetical protein
MYLKRDSTNLCELQPPSAQPLTRRRPCRTNFEQAAFFPCTHPKLSNLSGHKSVSSVSDSAVRIVEGAPKVTVTHWGSVFKYPGPVLRTMEYPAIHSTDSVLQVTRRPLARNVAALNKGYSYLVYSCGTNTALENGGSAATA